VTFQSVQSTPYQVAGGGGLRCAGALAAPCCPAWHEFPKSALLTRAEPSPNRSQDVARGHAHTLRHGPVWGRGHGVRSTAFTSVHDPHVTSNEASRRHSCEKHVAACSGGTVTHGHADPNRRTVSRQEQSHLAIKVPQFVMTLVSMICSMPQADCTMT